MSEGMTLTESRDVEQALYDKIAGELGISARQARAAAELLDEGGTVPFISRYRKEWTGSLNEVVVCAIRDRLGQLRSLERRRQAIVASLDERGLLTEELRDALLAAHSSAELEDLYRPYRRKRRTRAAVAREQGLEPLAEELLAQLPTTDPVASAAAYVQPERGVHDAAAALAGARDLIAELVGESAGARAEIRQVFEKKTVVRSRAVKGKEDVGAAYRDYFDWEEPLSKAPAHRIHALIRAEREGVIRLSMRPEESLPLKILQRRFVHGPSKAAEQVERAVEDGYKRLIAPSMENEVRLRAIERADHDAAGVFAENLRHILLAPPLGGKRVLAIDPGYRTGCKVVCLDSQGSLLAQALVHVVGSDDQLVRAGETLVQLVKRYAIEAIAVGNGTASREAMALVRSLDGLSGISKATVSEAGASVYSASDVARKELPDCDVTVRGAVSIGRRLLDPLAELVKIDPRSIGVGQYQHDVDPQLLKRALDDVVEQCVNLVGVDVNTASVPLLACVSGLSPRVAERIVEKRKQHGPFRSRADLRKVPGLGPKTYQQAAGFLRVRGGEDPLDASAVHPESYPVVQRMAEDLGCTVQELMRSPGLRERIDLNRYVSDKVGIPTLEDIVGELAKPGRDPRAGFEEFSFADGVADIADLTPGMSLPGIVTNVVNFGAFVDIGVKRDGLVHISQLADGFVAHPSAVVRPGQKVSVTVLDVDLERGRVGLKLDNEHL